MNKDYKHIDTRLGHLGLDPISNYGIQIPRFIVPPQSFLLPLPNIGASCPNPIPMGEMARQPRLPLKGLLPIFMARRRAFPPPLVWQL